jgi:hypothetical protein
MTRYKDDSGRYVGNPPADTQNRNRSAAEATIAALRSAGRLELIDSARIATLQTLADAVDADPVNASLWREYRAAESALREVHDDGNAELAEILERLSTPMVDATDAGTPKPRAKGRRSS